MLKISLANSVEKYLLHGEKLVGWNFLNLQSSHCVSKSLIPLYQPFAYKIRSRMHAKCRYNSSDEHLLACSCVRSFMHAKAEFLIEPFTSTLPSFLQFKLRAAYAMNFCIRVRGKKTAFCSAPQSEWMHANLISQTLSIFQWGKSSTLCRLSCKIRSLHLYKKESFV